MPLLACGHCENPFYLSAIRAMSDAEASPNLVTVGLQIKSRAHALTYRAGCPAGLNPNLEIERQILMARRRDLSNFQGIADASRIC
jgi:hypothetical protein